MTYDPANGEVVLFGGAGAGLLSDTWVWNGTDWTQRFPANVPPGRDYHALGWHDLHQRVVLFGGFGGAANFNDVWTWDGTDWTAETTFASSPAPRRLVQLAYDPNRNELVFYGGRVGGVGDVYETWALP